MKELLMDSEHIEFGTLGSNPSTPKLECRSILEDSSSIFHHHAEASLNSWLSKTRFSTTTRKHRWILDSTLGEFHGKLFVIMNDLPILP